MVRLWIWGKVTFNPRRENTGNLTQYSISLFSNRELGDFQHSEPSIDSVYLRLTMNQTLY